MPDFGMRNMRDMPDMRDVRDVRDFRDLQDMPMSPQGSDISMRRYSDGGPMRMPSDDFGMRGPRDSLDRPSYMDDFRRGPGSDLGDPMMRSGMTEVNSIPATLLKHLV